MFMCKWLCDYVFVHFYVCVYEFICLCILVCVSLSVCLVSLSMCSQKRNFAAFPQNYIFVCIF